MTNDQIFRYMIAGVLFIVFLVVLLAVLDNQGLLD
jgi:hypothetical protein